ncbi:MAG: EF-hand domain-containing protein [Burkholderiaceae bacterium]|nr:EF-hand domain-containing protein [Burkholderiaceae bacterium]
MMFCSRPFLALCALLPLAAAAQAPDSASAPASAPEPTAASASAPTSQPRRSSHVSEDQAMQWFNMLDTNHDGCISRDEARVAILVAPRLAKDFDEADTNHDGCITPDEIRALAKRRRAEREARRAAQARQKAAEQSGAATAASAPAP